jgi:3-deoxy-D-manno-octulosonate 8-phosphate phosphatase (KDO 8-P phosphatase)
MTKVSKSKKNDSLSIDMLDAICFDFDGVLTDNFVYVDQDGIETVRCSRSDGLAFDALNKLKVPVYVISSEKNLVVTARAKKLKINVIQGASNKVEILSQLAHEKNYDLSKFFFVGNDLNDFNAIKACGFSACPSDSHLLIKKISTYQLKTKGGSGVVRELIEDLFQIDLLKILF